MASPARKASGDRRGRRKPSEIVISALARSAWGCVVSRRVRCVSEAGSRALARSRSAIISSAVW